MNKIELTNNNFHSVWKRSVIERVSKNGELLQLESEIWREDIDVVRAAISHSPLAIQYAPKFHNDKRMAKFAIRGNGLAGFWVSPEVLQDPRICRLARENMPKESRRSFEKGIFSSHIGRSTFTKFLGFNEEDKDYITTPLIDEDCSAFLRDSRVVLLSGTHLLPFSIKEPFLARFMAMLPAYASHLFLKKNKLNQEGFIGQGYEAANINQAIVTSQIYNIPYKKAKTCIEGGNCFVFVSQGQKKAIVGEFSLYLSMIALDDQNEFESIKRDESIIPSSESIRLCRNMLLDEDREFIVQSEGELQYRRELFSPITGRDRSDFSKQAIYIEQCILYTKNKIAEELEIPLEHIAFIPQYKFHIDMEMFVTPEGSVILHDNEKALKLLLKIKASKKLSIEESNLLEKYLKVARKREHIYAPIHAKQLECLKCYNIPCTTLPAILENVKVDSSLNLCNGILLLRNDKPCFITTGITVEAENYFHKKITKLFKKAVQDIHMYYIPELSKYIAEYEGGLHCLTFESKNFFSS